MTHNFSNLPDETKNGGVRMWQHWLIDWCQILHYWTFYRKYISKLHSDRATEVINWLGFKIRKTKINFSNLRIHDESDILHISCVTSLTNQYGFKIRNNSINFSILRFLVFRVEIYYRQLLHKDNKIGCELISMSCQILHWWTICRKFITKWNSLCLTAFV